MDKYKHTCPACGQRIEYTIDYCDRQIACPKCQTQVIFPSAPPQVAPQKLRLQRDTAFVAKKSFLDHPFFKALLTFPHWKVVGACAVPFLLVAGLLMGASYLRKNPGESEATLPTAVASPINSDAWKKMADLGQMDQTVQARLRAVITAQASVTQSEREREALHAAYKGRSMEGPSGQGITTQYMAADRVVAARQQVYNNQRQAFETALDEYHKLGGQVDYRSQLPP